MIEHLNDLSRLAHTRQSGQGAILIRTRPTGSFGWVPMSNLPPDQTKEGHNSRGMQKQEIDQTVFFKGTDGIKRTRGDGGVCVWLFFSAHFSHASRSPIFDGMHNLYDGDAVGNWAHEKLRIIRLTRPRFEWLGPCKPSRVDTNRCRSWRFVRMDE